MRNKAFSVHVAVGLLAGLAATTLAAAPALAEDAPAKPAASAPAKPPTKKQKDAARKAYSEGEKAFNAGNYAAAQSAFERANDVIRSPQADYWIAKSLDAQNKTEEAIQAYETFLANPDVSKASDEKITDAKQRLEALKATLVAQVSIQVEPADAVVTVDGAPAEGQSPLQLELTPGKHHLSIAAPGYETKPLDLELKAGDHVTQLITLPKAAPPPAPVMAPPPPPPAPPPPPPPAEEHSMVPAYITLGIAGAAGVVGTIFGVKALGSKSDYDKTPTSKLADDTERSALISDMAFGVAITLGVTGIVLLTSDDEPPPSTAAAQSHATPARAKLDLTPYAGPKGGGASARLVF